MEDVKRLEEAVLVRRPVLKDIIEKKGQKNIIEYARDYLDVNLNDTLIQRRGEFLEVFEKVVEGYFGIDTAKEAVKQLKKYYFVSTADHHGPLCHPFFLNSHLVTSAVGLNSAQNTLKYIIALSCANVSFANSSFPRGLLFHGYNNKEIKMHQLGFFPNSSAVRQSRIFRHPAYSISAVEKNKEKLEKMSKEGEIGDETAGRLRDILDEIYSDAKVLGCKYYSDQITLTNFALWSVMFKKMGVDGPKMLYIELEKIVSELLIKHHLFQETLINKILFNSVYRDSYTKLFAEIEGGYSLKEDWGTVLFWALPEGDRYCLSLRLQDGFLVSQNNEFKIAMEPQAIKTALENKILLPSSQLSLLALSLYYGIKCLGGFCQVNYLTQMREAYKKFLTERGDKENMEACEKVQTKELGEDLSVAFLGEPGGRRELATSLDIILYGNGEAWNSIVDEANNMGFEQALAPMMPEFYHIMYPETCRDAKLSQITAEDIMRVNGLDKKVRPCAIIRH